MMSLYLQFLLLLACFMGFSQGDQLTVGFYSSTCPRAEEIVTNVARETLHSDAPMAGVLLRLQFHDCFVEGCDGSILISGGDNVESAAVGHQGVGGFEVVDQAKAQLERECPGVVSCADIIAMAARDAVGLINGPFYRVETGRRDGRVSNISLAADMPVVTDSIQQLKAKFSQKGLSDNDLVVLTAAHTIGTTACFFMVDWLYNFHGHGSSDGTINPNYLPELKEKCPQTGDIFVRLPLERDSPLKFDNKYTSKIKNGFVPLMSNAQLNEDSVTKSIVDSYSAVSNSTTAGPSFERDFVVSMLKMGRIGVKTGSDGEVPLLCYKFNHN